MYVSMASAPGIPTSPNADWMVSTPSLLVVGGKTASLWDLDVNPSCAHGIVWYVRQLVADILVEEANEPNALLWQIVERSIAHVVSRHKKSCNSPWVDEPAASLAIIRRRSSDAATRSDSIEYFVLGEISVVLEAASGPRVILDHRIKNLFSTQRRSVLAAIDGSLEREKLLAEMASAQRAMRNQPHGYWVAGSDPKAALQASRGGVPASQVSSIAIMTSGASRLVNLFGAVTWSDSFDLLRREGPGGWIERVRNFEAEDAERIRWPRIDVSIDSSVAFATFS